MSTFIKLELERVEREKNGLISNIRGLGLLIGFDVESERVA